MDGQSVYVPPLSPCLILASHPPDNFYLSSFYPNFYASSPTIIYLSPLFSSSTKLTNKKNHNKNKRRILCWKPHKNILVKKKTTQEHREIDFLILKKTMTYEKVNELNLKDTELRLGLPGTEQAKEEQQVSCVRSNKRQLQSDNEEESTLPTK